MNKTIKTASQTAVVFVATSLALTAYNTVKNEMASREDARKFYAALPATSRRITN